MDQPNPYNYFRSWMDKPMKDPATGLLTEEFADGIKQFMNLPENQKKALERSKIRCPCPNCMNNRSGTASGVWRHLYREGFMPGYKIWYAHGENESMVDFASSSNLIDDRMEETLTEHESVGTIQMVNDAFRENVPEFVDNSHRFEEPNLEARRFFHMLDAAKQPLYQGCRDGDSPLSTATKLMNIKSTYNLSEECVDVIADFVKNLLPEDNQAPGSYYEIQKMVKGLGLPYQVIDVCPKNCMLYWRQDEARVSCRFCGHLRYENTSGRVLVPFKRMWYLPLTARLKRLYQSERTASAMRWHAEHTNEGKISHPSDAKAWKHFNSTYPWFASERRNVYLGLSTDGFNPFGKHGRQYSLWPVIVTPYNLPPSMCMKREFLFLSILVPGPAHPKRSLDVFLQPLIHELKMLWEQGVETFDVSKQQNFRMHAVLMWTISDFPAYGMLSGWSTHGKLACPHCQHNTNSFHLKHGKKTSWFDCHRRFLPRNHPYRRSTTLFRKGKKVLQDPPPELDAEFLLAQFTEFDVKKTVVSGGNSQVRVNGVGDRHNWNKKSIFWDLPYWKTHLLRYNLDFMHSEKNIHDNIMNTVLNVQGKTKDNVNARLDLPEVCCRDALHIDEERRSTPVPAFRLHGPSRDEFFDWIINSVKFPDGYASSLRNCVDSGRTKFTGLKSHDCHVIMQRLLPFAFQGLLPHNVYTSIAAIGAFFRDLGARSLTEEGIRNLEEKIPVIICNLEKIFPPSFFDVMEHLPIHLPKEAELGGPVHYRWMYPFERYMFHLKKKVKNLSRVEGSIVSQNINEEASNFAKYYFAPQVQQKIRKTARNDDGGEAPSYVAHVPEVFRQVGRLSGKGKNRRLTKEERAHLHLYILTNCEDVLEYEQIYMTGVRSAFPQFTEEQVVKQKEKEFPEWLKFYVTTMRSRGEVFPTWLEELISPPLFVAMSYPAYFTRGYAFKIFREDNTRSTSNSGVSSKSIDMVYYGVLHEILEVHFPGMLDLRFIAFNCHWYNPIDGYGVRQDEFGVTSVHSRRRLNKYDPFVLASQTDQVCYIRYPRITNRADPWITVTEINPRGTIFGESQQEPLQQNLEGGIGSLDHSLDVELVVDLTEIDNAIYDDSEEEIGEFEEDTDSDSLDYSSDTS